MSEVSDVPIFETADPAAATRVIDLVAVIMAFDDGLPVPILAMRFVTCAVGWIGHAHIKRQLGILVAVR